MGKLWAEARGRIGVDDEKERCGREGWGGEGRLGVGWVKKKTVTRDGYGDDLVYLFFARGEKTLNLETLR